MNMNEYINLIDKLCFLNKKLSEYIKFVDDKRTFNFEVWYELCNAIDKCYIERLNYLSFQPRDYNQLCEVEFVTQCRKDFSKYIKDILSEFAVVETTFVQENGMRRSYFGYFKKVFDDFYKKEFDEY